MRHDQIGPVSSLRDTLATNMEAAYGHLQHPSASTPHPSSQARTITYSSSQRAAWPPLAGRSTTIRVTAPRVRETIPDRVCALGRSRSWNSAARSGATAAPMTITQGRATGSKNNQTVSEQYKGPMPLTSCVSGDRHADTKKKRKRTAGAAALAAGGGTAAVAAPDRAAGAGAGLACRIKGDHLGLVWFPEVDAGCTGAREPL